METKFLLKLSLVVAILGTLAIAFLSDNIEPKTTEISSINERMLDEWVKISGNVVAEKNLDNLQILTVDDGSAAINAVLRENASGFQGHSVAILGKVIEYDNELEIEISSIKNAP
jgi:RecJ-like exonuclease